MTTLISHYCDYGRTFLRQDIRRLISTLQAQKNCCHLGKDSKISPKYLHISPCPRAGHNRWSKIHRKKAIADMERSKTIQKFVNQIINAIRTGGGPDPDSNVRLASMIEQARNAGVTKANIDAAVRRATSKQDCGELAIFEGRGEAGYMLIIETITDNKNRTRPTLRSLLSKQNCILGEAGSSLFNFDHKGVIRVPCKELRAASVDPMDLAIEVEAEDVTDDSQFESAGETHADSVLPDEICFQFKCEPKDLKAVSDALIKRSFSVSSASLEYVPKMLVPLGQREYNRAVRVVNLLGDVDEVVEVYDNFTLSGNG